MAKRTPSKQVPSEVQALRQRKEEKQKEVDELARRERKMLLEATLESDAEYQKLLTRLKKIDGELHHTRICIARKNTSIKSHEAKIAQRRDEVAELESKERDKSRDREGVTQEIEEMKSRIEKQM